MPHLLWSHPKDRPTCSPSKGGKALSQDMHRNESIVNKVCLAFSFMNIIVFGLKLELSLETDS